MKNESAVVVRGAVTAQVLLAVHFLEEIFRDRHVLDGCTASGRRINGYGQMGWEMD